MSIDKNKAIVNFLLTCPTFQTYQLYFNYAEESDNAHQMITMADTVKKVYIDGSKDKTYTFTLVSFKSIEHIPLISTETDGNISDMAAVQEIMDWINEQGAEHNYPDFGDGYIINDMKCLTDDPNLFGVDTSVNPPLAKYSFVIRIEYLDTTEVLWNN